MEMVQKSHKNPTFDKPGEQAVRDTVYIGHVKIEIYLCYLNVIVQIIHQKYEHDHYFTLIKLV